MNEYVIIGNGVAAAGCIEGIRSADSEGRITVVSEERHPVYCRPLISYMLEGKTAPGKMNYRDEGFYERNGCRVIYGKKAVSLDPVKKSVVLEGGEELNYGSVCVATGSSPFVPPFSGLETVENKFTFMTLDDAEALKNAVTGESSVLIVGGGLIGLKCAEGLHGLAGKITVCDLADRILSSILDSGCAAFVQKHIEEMGIEFMLSDSATGFDGNTALMRSGRKVKFDVLVLAVGVRANISLVKDAGGECGRGISVNGKGETSLPFVYAAGDCTECTDISSGARRVLAILPNAYMQGHAAGVNMAGGEEDFDCAVPMNSAGFFGLHVMTAGSYDGECDDMSSESGIKRFYVKDGYLTGFILVGQTERAGIYTGLIRNRVPLSEIDLDLMKKIPSNLIFSSKIRKKRFGKVV